MEKQEAFDDYLKWLSGQENCPSEFGRAPKKFRANKHVVMEVCKLDGECLMHAPRALQDDRDVVWEACKRSRDALRHASYRLRNDKRLILDLFSFQTGYAFALQHASVNIRDDPDVVLEAVRCSGSGLAIQFASQRLCNDRKFFLEVCKIHQDCYTYASPRLRDDREFLLETFQAGKNVPFQLASERLRNDKDVVLIACRADGKNFQYASERLRREKKVVLEVVAVHSDALKFAAGGLNQDRDCLIAAGIWDKNYKAKAHNDRERPNTYNNPKRNLKVVLSTKFSLTPESESQATQFAVLLKNHPYILATQFEIYSPNAFDKSTCDPKWTRFDWPCRGTYETCRFDAPLKTGIPQRKSCWRYSFRYQLEDAKASQGFMIQLVEGGSFIRNTRISPHTLGNGQKIEREMAHEIQTKIFQVYAPTQLHSVGRLETDFTDEDMEEVVLAIRDWYDSGCADMSDCTIRIEKDRNMKDAPKQSPKLPQPGSNVGWRDRPRSTWDHIDLHHHLPNNPQSG